MISSYKSKEVQKSTELEAAKREAGIDYGNGTTIRLSLPMIMDGDEYQRKDQDYTVCT